MDVRSPSQTHGQLNPFGKMWQNTIDTFKNGISRVFPGGPEIGEYGIEPYSVLQTPYAADAVPEPNPQGRPESTTSSIGAAGTAIYSGFVTDLGEYKASLMGNNAFPTWEQMRRSDPDVYAGLLSCKLPVRAAQYQIIPGATAADPNHKLALEIAKFVEDNLFGGLETMTSTGFFQTQSFEKVIENALLMLDFGCACDEILWHVDGDKVRVRRLAPRLPITYFRYWPDSDGETLLALEQYGYRGDEYVNVVLPAEKINYYVHEQEGADYFGFSILRRAYQPWYFKTRLYAIDGIALERNAMGVPWIKMASGYAKEDRQYATKFVTAYSAHENTGLVTPDTWNFEIVGTKGRLRDPKTSIQHFSEQILRGMLAGFLAYGTTQTGSRSLAGDMIGFFKMSLNALARNITATLTNNVVRRLVDYNYGDSRKAIPYPSLVSSNIIAIDPLETIKAIQSLATWQTGLLTPTDKTEDFIRKELGWPLLDTPRPRMMPVQTRLEPRETLTPEQAEEQILEITEHKVDVKNNPNLNPTATNPVPTNSPTQTKSNIIPTHPNRPDRESSKAKSPHAETSGGKQSASEDGVDPEIAVRVVELLHDFNKNRTIACDFDGVICIYPVEHHISDPNEFGYLSQNGVALIDRLRSMGFEVIVCTARRNTSNVAQYLKQHGVVVDGVTHDKIPALAYIDDRGVHVDWGIAYDQKLVDSILRSIDDIIRTHRDKSPRVDI